MQPQRPAGRSQGPAGETGPRRAGGGRPPRPVYPGEIHAAALEYVSPLDDAALTAAAFAPLPVIAAKAASFDTLQLRDKAVLQIKKISVDRSRVHLTDSQVKIFVRQRRGVRCRADTACRRNGCLP